MHMQMQGGGEDHYFDSLIFFVRIKMGGFSCRTQFTYIFYFITRPMLLSGFLMMCSYSVGRASSYQEEKSSVEATDHEDLHQ